MTSKIELADVDDLIEEYRSGVSVKKLSDKLGVCRQVIGRILAEHDVQLRGRSEAEYVKWSILKLDRAAVKRQCGAAWAAVTGSTVPLERKIKMARTHQRRLTRIGAFEDDIATLLRERGVNFMSQFAVGPYNIDLAVKESRLAVEVVSTTAGYAGDARLRKRTEYLFDRGWCVIFVSLRTRPQHADPGFSDIADKLVSIHKRLCSGEPLRGKYGVIGRHGQTTTMCRRQLDGLPTIE